MQGNKRASIFEFQTVAALAALGTLIAGWRHWGIEALLAVATIVTAVALLGRLAVRRDRGITTPLALVEAIVGVGALVIGLGGLIKNEMVGALIGLLGVLIIAGLILYGFRRGKQARTAAP